MYTKKLPYDIKISSTPWDSNAFGLNTFEISIGVDNIDTIDTIANELNKITSVKDPTLFYCRIDANDKKSKAALLKSGFLNCETQLHITKALGNYSIPKEIGARRFPVKIANDDDYLDVCKKASDTFKYSRFHEDPFIGENLSNLRMHNWCRDMHRQNVPLLVSRSKNGDLDSFIFYKKINERKVELILGGSVPGKGVLTPLFWASFIEYFRDLGINTIETKISASNIGIANIYLFFNFKIKSTYFDFHKHVNCNLLK